LVQWNPRGRVHHPQLKLISDYRHMLAHIGALIFRDPTMVGCAIK